MAITIHYTIRLAHANVVAPFLAAARAEARRRKWKIQRSTDNADGITIIPHARSEPIRLAFSKRLVCEDFVKTGFAPLRTHIAVVEFLRALQPLAKSMKVEDEGEYWQTGDAARLKRLRDDFDMVFDAKPLEPGREIVFTLGAMVGKATPDGEMKFVKGPAKVVRVTDPLRPRAGKRRQKD